MAYSARNLFGLINSVIYENQSHESGSKAHLMIYDKCISWLQYVYHYIWSCTVWPSTRDSNIISSSSSISAAAWRHLRVKITAGDSSGWTHAGRTPTSHLPYVALHLLTVIKVIRMRLDLATQEADSADMNNAARSRNRATQNRILIRSSQST